MTLFLVRVWLWSHHRVRVGASLSNDSWTFCLLLTLLLEPPPPPHWTSRCVIKIVKIKLIVCSGEKCPCFPFSTSVFPPPVDNVDPGHGTNCGGIDSPEHN